MKSVASVLLTLLVTVSTARADILTTLSPTAGGLTTTAVVEMATATSPQLRRSQNEHRKAKARADSAYAGFAPRVDLNASYARLSHVDLPPMMADFFPLFQDNYSFTGNIMFPASDYFMSIVHLYDSTILGEEVARLQADSQRETVALNAIGAYLGTINARAAALVVEESLAVLQKQLDDTSALVDAGLATGGDKLAVQAQVAATKVELQRAKAGWEVAQQRLRRMIGDDHAELAHGEDIFATPEPRHLDQATALDSAFQQRAEVQALTRLIELNENLVSFNRGGMYPHLALGGGIESANPNQRAFSMKPEYNTTWRLQAVLSWSPNDFIASRTLAREAEADVASTRADLDGLRDMISIEVSDALTGLRTNEEAIAAANERHVAARGAFEDRKQLLAAGQSTTRDLLLAEQDLRAAQLGLVQAHLALRLSHAQLDRALGRLTTGVN